MGLIRQFRLLKLILSLSTGRRLEKSSWPTDSAPFGRFIPFSADGNRGVPPPSDFAKGGYATPGWVGGQVVRELSVIRWRRESVWSRRMSVSGCTGGWCLSLATAVRSLDLWYEGWALPSLAAARFAVVYICIYVLIYV